MATRDALGTRTAGSDRGPNRPRVMARRRAIGPVCNLLTSNDGFPTLYPMTARRSPARHAPNQVAQARLWERIVDELGVEIEKGRPGPGHRLPSEAQLCERFSVSRVTLRQALKELERSGLIEPRAGSGWFVSAPATPGRRTSQQSAAAPLSEPPGRLLSYSDMARARGLNPDSVVLEQRVRPASMDDAETLAIAPGADLLSLRRLRRLDGLPVAIDHSLIPAAYLPDALTTDYAAGSLHESLREVGIRLTRSEHELMAIAADEERADLLDVAAGYPLLAVWQVMFDQTGRPIEKGYITYRGDRYRFSAVVHA